MPVTIPPEGEYSAHLGNTQYALQGAYACLVLAVGSLEEAALAAADAGYPYDRAWAEQAEELRSQTLRLLNCVNERVEERREKGLAEYRKPNSSDA